MHSLNIVVLSGYWWLSAKPEFHIEYGSANVCLYESLEMTWKMEWRICLINPDELQETWATED